MIEEQLQLNFAADLDPRKNRKEADNDDSLVEVRKSDTAEDSDYEFVRYDEPFDEQMHDEDPQDFDEEAD